MTIERLTEAPLILADARYGWSDPARRQLLERAQRAGVILEPQIESSTWWRRSSWRPAASGARSRRASS
jgi:hypothetical protein